MSKVKLTRFGFEAILDEETVKKNMDNYKAMFGKTKLEVHADGVKEVREQCPFCKPSWCDTPHCPYTPKEE